MDAAPLRNPMQPSQSAEGKVPSSSPGTQALHSEAASLVLLRDTIGTQPSWKFLILATGFRSISVVSTYVLTITLRIDNQPFAVFGLNSPV